MAAKQHFNNFMIVVSGSCGERSRKGEKKTVAEGGREVEEALRGRWS